jgi:hypothetical protein
MSDDDLRMTGIVCTAGHAQKGTSAKLVPMIEAHNHEHAR